MATEYVAYTALGSCEPGDVVNPANWSAEEWRYMVEHEVVVPKNSPNDPNVLAQATGAAGHEAALLNPDAPVSAAVQEALDAHAAATGKADEVKDEDETEPADADKDKEPVKLATPTPAPAPVKPVAKPLPKP
jgi:hypothetical protein